MQSHWLYILISVVLTLYGILSIKERVFKLGLGRPPFFILTLDGDFAVCFGITAFFSGIINLVLQFFDVPGWLFEVAFVGGLCACGIVLLLCIVIQYTLHLGRWIKDHETKP